MTITKTFKSAKNFEIVYKHCFKKSVFGIQKKNKKKIEDFFGKIWRLGNNEKKVLRSDLVFFFVLVCLFVCFVFFQAKTSNIKI